MKKLPDTWKRLPRKVKKKHFGTRNYRSWDQYAELFEHLFSQEPRKKNEGWDHAIKWSDEDIAASKKDHKKIYV